MAARRGSSWPEPARGFMREPETASGSGARAEAPVESGSACSTRPGGSHEIPGIDVHSRATVWCLLDDAGETVGRGRVATTADGLASSRPETAAGREIRAKRGPPRRGRGGGAMEARNEPDQVGYGSVCIHELLPLSRDHDRKPPSTETVVSGRKLAKLVHELGGGKDLVAGKEVGTLAYFVRDVLSSCGVKLLSFDSQQLRMTSSVSLLTDWHLASALRSARRPKESQWMQAVR